MSDIPDRTRAEVQRDLAVATLEFIAERGWGGFICEIFARKRLAEIAEVGNDAPPSGWQPIETAPKDSTKIDVWLQIYSSPRSFGWADSFRVPEAWWQESTKEWVHLHEGKAQPLYAEYVTHWMPLPEPPTEGPLTHDIRRMREARGRANPEKE